MQLPKILNVKLPTSSLGFERLANLSDGVIAIIITLMVLELKVPHIETESEEELVNALLQYAPVLISLIISFFVVGMLWVEHHRLFRYVKKYDLGLIWRNLVFLGFISFIPFPTAVFGEHTWSRAAFMFYALTIGLCGAAKIELMTHAWKARLMDSRITPYVFHRMKLRSYALPMTASLAAIVANFAGPGWGAMTFIALPWMANLLARYKGRTPKSPEMVTIHTSHHPRPRQSVVKFEPTVVQKVSNG
jgi:uncharacterized membrane protein